MEDGVSESGSKSAYPKVVDRLIERFAELPGIGRRSAERLAFHVLKGSKDDAMALAKAISDAKVAVRNCRVCWNLSDQGHVRGVRRREARSGDGLGGGAAQGPDLDRADGDVPRDLPRADGSACARWTTSGPAT
jgi:hypothetical protein